jgi:hypothetical protein
MHRSFKDKLRCSPQGHQHALGVLGVDSREAFWADGMGDRAVGGDCQKVFTFAPLTVVGAYALARAAGGDHEVKRFNYRAFFDCHRMCFPHAKIIRPRHPHGCRGRLSVDAPPPGMATPCFAGAVLTIHSQASAPLTTLRNALTSRDVSQLCQRTANNTSQRPRWTTQTTLRLN